MEMKLYHNSPSHLKVFENTQVLERAQIVFIVANLFCREISALWIFIMENVIMVCGPILRNGTCVIPRTVTMLNLCNMIC
jgi:hypothetical protein